VLKYICAPSFIGQPHPDNLIEAAWAAKCRVDMLWTVCGGQHENLAHSLTSLVNREHCVILLPMKNAEFGLRLVRFVVRGVLRCFTLAMPLVCTVTAGGCAQIANGPHGIYLDPNGHPSEPAARSAKLQISAGEVVDMSSPYLGEIEFTFENPTTKWIRVEKVQLDFGGEKANQAIGIPWGSQLESWAEAINQRNAIRNANRRTSLEILSLSGSLVSAAAPRNAHGALVAGGIASLGAATATYVAETQTRAEAAEHAPTFGHNHIFSGPFDVPPGLFAKRWLVASTPADPRLGCITSVTMIFELADKSSHHVALDFRAVERSPPSLWQRENCRFTPK
jgi:hypothetical protein